MRRRASAKSAGGAKPKSAPSHAAKARLTSTTPGPGVRGRGAGGLVDFYVNAAKGVVPADSLTVASQVQALAAGLPETELNDLQDSLGLSAEKLASLVGLSKSTFHRRKTAGTPLNPLVSDRVVRFARLLSKAITVFGSQDDANKWLGSPQFGLGGEIPLDYAKTEIGAREVENLLGRIEYGVYA